jgi:hypothetical protein
MALLRLAAVRQCRHATMRAGELNAKLVWPHVRHHRLRLLAGSRLVVTPSPGSSPPARTPPCPPCVCDRWARRPHCQPLWCRAGENALGAPSVLRAGFEKGI